MKKLMIAMSMAALAAAVFAQEPGGPAADRPMRPMPSRPERQSMGFSMAGDPLLRAVMNPKVAEAIELTDEQKAKVKKLRSSGGSRELQERFRKGMEKQSALLQAEAIDEAAVMAAVDETWEARKELAKEQTRRLIAVRSILTPEQVKKALSVMRDKGGAPGLRRNGKGKPGNGAKPLAPAEKPAEAPATPAAS